jgi:hypothetical protein
MTEGPAPARKDRIDSFARILSNLQPPRSTRRNDGADAITAAKRSPPATEVALERPTTRRRRRVYVRLTNVGRDASFGHVAELQEIVVFSASPANERVSNVRD